MDLDYKKLPLDTGYAKQPSIQKGTYLKFIISHTPDDPSRYPGIIEEFTTFDDKLLFNKSAGFNVGEKTDYQIFLVIAGFVGIIMPLIGTIMNGFDSSSFSIMVTIALVCLLVAYSKYKKWKETPDYQFSVYDRLNGQITLPDYHKEFYFKIPFNQLKAQIHKIVYPGMVSGLGMPFNLYYFLKEEQKKSVRYEDLYVATILPRNIDTQQSWSFFVWYMDKNRPLPPSKAFDAYRQEDFERRKAEGFPPPLYKSVIPTPEATPEQQLVREAFWKDEDHMEIIGIRDK